MAEHRIQFDPTINSKKVFFEDLLHWADSLAPKFKQCSFYDAGHGFIDWSPKGQEILDSGPDRLTSLGFLVEEFEGGWSAVLPMSGLPKIEGDAISKGACFVATAKRIKTRNKSFIRLSVSEFIWHNFQSPLQEHGWQFRSKTDDKMEILTYEFHEPSDMLTLLH